MKSVEKSGRSVEEAVAMALEELGVPGNQAEVEVLEAPKGGLFGFLGPRQAVVRVSVRRSLEEQVEAYLAGICQAAALDARVSAVRSDENLRVSIHGGRSSALIGHRGQTLEALQLLTSLVARGQSGEREAPRVLVDVEGYRERREETLIRLAERMGERVERTGQRVALEPMSAQDRRIIHMALSEHPRLVTVSEGDEPQRRVVIMPRQS